MINNISSDILYLIIYIIIFNIIICIKYILPEVIRKYLDITLNITLNITSSIQLIILHFIGLDGSTSAIEREKLINQFNGENNEKYHIFLLSTKFVYL